MADTNPFLKSSVQASGSISPPSMPSGNGMDSIEREYELLPHEELEQLRSEIKKIRRNPLGESDTASALYAKMDELTRSINRLVAILETANRSVIADFERNNPSGKLQQALDQNQKIAQGIVALAEMLKRLQPQPNQGPQQFSSAQSPAATAEQKSQARPPALSNVFQSDPQQPPMPDFTGKLTPPSFAPMPPLPNMPSNSSMSSTGMNGQRSSSAAIDPSMFPPLPPPGFLDNPMASSNLTPPPTRKGMFSRFSK